MSVAVAPVPARTDAPSRAFFALVRSVHTGLLSSTVNCLFVDVLAGSIERGDAVEVVRADGSVASVVGHRIRSGAGEVVLDLDDPHPPKSLLAGAIVARTPGLIVPPLPVDGGPGLERLLAATRQARAQGFPTEWAQPIRPVSDLKAEEITSLLRMLSDEAAALLVQKRVKDSTAHHDNPFQIMGDVQKAAMFLGAVGLREDGDRLLLAAAAAVQGHQAGTLLRAAGTVGSIGVLGAENALGAGLDMGKRIGWAIGIEMGDVFARQFQSNVAVGGAVVEDSLLEANRAVGLAWCKGCRDVVQLSFSKSGLTGSRQLRCPNDGRKVDEPLLVVPSDAADVQAAMRARAR